MVLVEKNKYRTEIVIIYNCNLLCSKKCSPLNVHHGSKYFDIIDSVGIDILAQ